MNDMVKNADTPWLSTYGILTAERLLERFQITLSREELIDALTHQNSPYHHLLTLPIKNISNGIIMKQVHDYQVYMQKLLIDYKLNAVNVDIQQPHQGSTQAINVKIEELSALSALFEEKKHEHQQLIAKSQSWLIQQTHESMFNINPETSDHIEQFKMHIESLSFAFQNLICQFREFIIQTTELLELMPDYTLDAEQMEHNKTFLEFDPLLTENMD